VKVYNSSEVSLDEDGVFYTVIGALTYLRSRDGKSWYRYEISAKYVSQSLEECMNNTTQFLTVNAIQAMSDESMWKEEVLL